MKEQAKMDLEKLREQDKLEAKKPLTEEDIKTQIEQDKLGQMLDAAWRREMYLRDNRKLLDHDSFILSKLPIDDDTREKLYQAIISLKTDDDGRPRTVTPV